MLSCVWLFDPMDYSPPGSSVHEILQARIPEWVAIFLQGIFLTQGSNPGVLYCRQILFHLSHQGSSNYISVVRYMVAKFNKKHFTHWFNMFFSFCVYLLWKLLSCWFQTKVLNGYKFDLSGSYCMVVPENLFLSLINGFLIIYIWNSSSVV